MVTTPSSKRFSSLADVIGSFAENGVDADETCAACNALRGFGMDPAVFRGDVIQVIPLITKVIRENVGNRAVQKCATMAVAGIAEKKDIHSELALSGCVEAMLVAWDRSRDHQSLVKDMLVAFRTLTTQEDCRRLTCDCGGIGLTVSAMLRFDGHESIHIHAVSLLVNLAFGSKAAKIDICNQGGASATVQCLQRFKSLENAKLVRKCCTLLRNLAAESISSSGVIVEEGSIGSLTAILKRFRSEPSVLEESISALSNMANMSIEQMRKSPSTKRLIETVGIMLVQTKSRLCMYGRFHELSMKLLCALAVDDENMQIFVGEKALLSVVCVMQAHEAHVVEFDHHKEPQGNVQFKQKSQSYQTLARAAGLVRCLAFADGNRRIIENADCGVDVLLRNVEVLRKEPLSVEQALLALGNMLFDSTCGKIAISKHEGVNTVMNVSLDFQHISGVQEATCLALRSICDASSENVEAAVRFGGVQSMLRVLHNFRENPMLQEQALAVLVIFVQISNNLCEKDLLSIRDEAGNALSRFPNSAVLRAQKELLYDHSVARDTHNHRRRGMLRLSMGSLGKKLSTSKL